MDNAGGATGSARGKIVLFDQQCAFAAARALTRNGNAVDSAADYEDIKGLTSERSAVMTVVGHDVCDAKQLLWSSQAIAATVAQSSGSMFGNRESRCSIFSSSPTFSPKILCVPSSLRQ